MAKIVGGARDNRAAGTQGPPDSPLLIKILRGFILKLRYSAADIRCGTRPRALSNSSRSSFGMFFFEISLNDIIHVDGKASFLDLAGQAEAPCPIRIKGNEYHSVIV